jgi:RsiW-degrading membrane proteinase PrsW (M82 family)
MAELISNNIFFVALVTGIVPTILWLLFWLREDRFQPEPIGLLILTYIAGALSVILILPLETVVSSNVTDITEKILIFAFIEEFIKFFVVFLIDFHSSYLDEPIDYAVYLITGSLGFATMENVLFILNNDQPINISFIIETGTLRFLGATILHSLLAAILGIILGFVFYKKKSVKRLFIVFGIGITTILHTFFNYFIIKHVDLNGFLVFGFLWAITLIIISLFERVRRINH